MLGFKPPDFPKKQSGGAEGGKEIWEDETDRRREGMRAKRTGKRREKYKKKDNKTIKALKL